jgi:hypothetical protein
VRHLIVPSSSGSDAGDRRNLREILLSKGIALQVLENPQKYSWWPQHESV